MEKDTATWKNGSLQNDKILLPTFTNDKILLFVRGISSEIFKELQKLDMKKTNNKTDKWDMDLNKEFSKEESQMAEKYLNLQHP